MGERLARRKNGVSRQRRVRLIRCIPLGVRNEHLFSKLSCRGLSRRRDHVIAGRPRTIARTAVTSVDDFRAGVGRRGGDAAHHRHDLDDRGCDAAGRRGETTTGTWQAKQGNQQPLHGIRWRGIGAAGAAGRNAWILRPGRITNSGELRGECNDVCARSDRM